MGDDCWCRHLVAMRGAVDRRAGVVRERPRMAARGRVDEAMVCKWYVGCLFHGSVVAIAEFLGEYESFGINRPYDVYRIIQRHGLARGKGSLGS